MDKNVQGRILEIINGVCKGNKSEFCRRIGRKPDAVKDIIGGRGSLPSYDLIYDILASDLGISPAWFILGIGEMTERATVRESASAIDYAALKETIKQALIETRQ